MLGMINSGLPHLALFLIGMQAAVSANDLANPPAVREVGITQGELRGNLRNGRTESSPWVDGRIVWVLRDGQAISPLADDAPELPPAKLVLPLLNGGSHTSVPILGQIVPQEQAYASRADGGKDGGENGVHSVFEKMMLGWAIGTVFVIAVALALRGYFLPNANVDASPPLTPQDNAQR